MEKSQAQRLHELLRDFRPHSTIEIMEKVYGGSHLGLARVGARIFDLKSRGAKIKGWRDPENPAIYIYQLQPAETLF
jgi:hypothetical protein